MRKLYNAVTALLLILWDAAAVVSALIFGSNLYSGFNTKYPPNFLGDHIVMILLWAAICVICNAIFGCYMNVWRHAGVGEYVKQCIAVLVSTAIIFVLNRIKQIGTPEEVIIITALVEFILMLFIRVSVALFSWINTRVTIFRRRKGMKRVLIFGAGEAGTNLVNKLESHPDENRFAVGFIDDNRAFWGRKILGKRVLGGREKLAETIKNNGIQEVILAIPTADRDTVKFALNCCHSSHCRLKRFGLIDDVNEDSLKNAKISDINLEDLLRRDSVKLNMDAVHRFISGKTVLVTGGAGSIGTEICRQVLNSGAEKLIIFDICENGLYEIDDELKGKYDTGRYALVLGSVRDRARLKEVFTQYRPQVVFHAAAHKHVPMMELNPKEAVKNNVFGTINVAEAAADFGAEKFILISTDKAVNPANIMGASKRIAEMAVQTVDKASDTEFAAVRFGNVLGSIGSVVPHFKKQIAEGGPVTVTDKKMRRYFMTIPEAVQLVLEAGAMAAGGEIFVLDMGEPVYIYDLACDLIRLSGLEPDKDIKINIIGPRPGEKLFEELSLKNENAIKTGNNKIYICKPVQIDTEEFAHVLAKIKDSIAKEDKNGMFDNVRELVPTFSDNA